ncbi:1931_t:CDS:1, partial [Funneliformis geosporum]
FQQQRRQQITLLFLILQILIANKRFQNIQMQRIFNIYHLLNFNYTVVNSTILFPSQNARIQSWPRPKTEGFWTDVFPYLIDEDSYNSFRRHFRITLTTFRALVIRLENHPAFISDASNATPVWKQIAIVLWRLANGGGMRVLEQTLG